MEGSAKTEENLPVQRIPEENEENKLPAAENLEKYSEEKEPVTEIVEKSVNESTAEKSVKEKLLEKCAESSVRTGEENQKFRSFLRGRFLRTMTMLEGRECVVSMFEDTTKTVTFNGYDFRKNQILVRDLDTFLGVLPHALLRVSDVLHITFKDVDFDSFLNEKQG